PGRLQVIGADPTVLVDAAHNPGGAASLAAALDDYFHLGEIAVVFGVMADKDLPGILDHVGPHGSVFFASQSHSSRALGHSDLARKLASRLGDQRVHDAGDVADALEAARAWAGAASGRAVLVTGSIALVGDALGVAAEHGWLRETGVRA
ncbi:MAG TPA: cyanophycin synthetase, partial [Microbacteriaceae bacterium]|nr:cyanophycin synthetase [Microbacteriaceae bacterium]